MKTRPAVLPGGRRRGSGFTLLEVLVALAVLGVAAGSLLAAQSATTRLVRQSVERDNAFWLARARLVEALAYPDRSPPEDTRPDRYLGVDYTTRIEYREMSPVPEVKLEQVPRERRLVEIRAIVSWGSGGVPVQLSAYRPLVAKGER